jgi:hypothetical protein
MTCSQKKSVPRITKSEISAFAQTKRYFSKRKGTFPSVIHKKQMMAIVIPCSSQLRIISMRKHAWNISREMMELQPTRWEHYYCISLDNQLWIILKSEISPVWGWLVKLGHNVSNSVALKWPKMRSGNHQKDGKQLEQCDRWMITTSVVSSLLMANLRYPAKKIAGDVDNPVDTYSCKID